MDLRKNYLRDVPLEHCIKRGTAEVLEESDNGLFLWDNIGYVYMLVTDDYEEGVTWLKKHEDRNYDLMTLYRDDLSNFVSKRYGLSVGMECYQGVWLKPEAPPFKGLLEFRTASLDDMDFILAHYAKGSEEWMTEVINLNLLNIAHDKDGNAVGLAGQHLEGSIGMVEVLPEYRNLGYGTELESYMIDKILKEGYTPYGQVYSDNEISMNLQKKLGFEFWDGMMRWLYNEDYE